MLPTDPRRLLLLDGCGAVVTAAMMFLVLAPLEDFFGFPKLTAQSLGALGVCFALFSFSSALRDEEDKRPFLRTIALANLTYCIGSVALMFVHAGVLSTYGFLYLGGEILVVALLASYELKIAMSD